MHQPKPCDLPNFLATQALMCPSCWRHRATNQVLTHKAAATLPSQVVREVDPFAHFASDYGKQQGPRHLACGLAAALQERDRCLRPGGFRNTPGLASSGRVRSCGVPSSNTPVRRWVSSSPHHQLCSPLCTWRTLPAPAPPGWPSWAPGRSVTGTVHQWQQQEADGSNQTNHFTLVLLQSAWN